MWPGVASAASTLPDLEKRGGLLGHASILTLTSYPERTTPVLRGKWILENILGRHVPPPPPNLDTSLEIPEDQGTVRKPTIRERLAKHRTEADVRQLPPDDRSAGLRA